MSTIRVTATDIRGRVRVERVTLAGPACDDCTYRAGTDQTCCCEYTIPGTFYCDLHTDARRILAEMDAEGAAFGHAEGSPE